MVLWSNLEKNWELASAKKRTRYQEGPQV